MDLKKIFKNLQDAKEEAGSVQATIVLNENEALEGQSALISISDNPFEEPTTGTVLDEEDLEELEEEEK